MEFNFDNERPIYVQLVEQLEKCIVTGHYKPGTRLPSVRELAATTKVNPNTMQKALVELETSHLIYTERTNGKFVTEDTQLIKERGQKFAREKAIKYLNDMSELGYSKDEAVDYLNNLGE